MEEVWRGEACPIILRTIWGNGGNWGNWDDRMNSRFIGNEKSGEMGEMGQ